MLHSNNSTKKPINIIWPIAYIGAAIGLFLSWFVLSGDEQGRVNLLYLLLIYLLIPLVSIIASLFSLFFGNGINLARIVTKLPIWSTELKSLLRNNHQLNLDKHWFLLQSQAAAIAFSAASMITFFILLLATDLNFIWRSTILDATDIYPILEFIALPWQFWSAAQPDLGLLELTQDSRILDAISTKISSDVSVYGSWWKFILATQLCYSLFLRVLLILWTRWWLVRAIDSDVVGTLQNIKTDYVQSNNRQAKSIDVVHQIPNNIKILNWDDVPHNILSLLTAIDLTNENQLINGWKSSDEQTPIAEQSDSEQLVIVKGWEGPLGELEDFLKENKGYLLPLDWDDSGLVKLTVPHFQEWQRLVANLPNWQLFIPKDLMQKNLLSKETVPSE